MTVEQHFRALWRTWFMRLICAERWLLIPDALRVSSITEDQRSLHQRSERIRWVGLVTGAGWQRGN